MNREKIDKILNLLEREYPDADCALQHKNAFELLVAVALSAQTTDVSVNKVTPILFNKFPTVYDLAKASEEEVIAIIRTIGMYKTKSRNIINMSKMLVEEYDGQVPKNDEELVKLPGVGRKTANVVVSVAFGCQRIAVDTHVFRVSNRIGIIKATDVVKTEVALMKKIPEDRWTKTHHSLIFHGRRCCTARKPNCDSCVIKELCMKRF